MTSTAKLRAYLSDEIAFPRADLVLLLLSFATGIVDVFTFSKLGAFVANMTGNVVFLGAGIAGVQHSSIHADRAITSMACFCAGSFLTGQLSTHVGGKRRWFLFLILCLQSLTFFITAILLYTSVIRLSSESNLALIAVLSLAFGSQGAAGRLLASTPITTVVVTSAMFDLFADPKLFVGLKENTARNHRVAFIGVFFAGTIVGGEVMVHGGGTFTLVLAGLVKLLAAMVLLVVKGKRKEVERPSEEEDAGAVREGQWTREEVEAHANANGAAAR
ncbi:hypothetical protein MNV49_007372 [Pseudohyphozyma bogoriensis]|nr:hypothetical protein MNV49_007372 [Pseudohyphozyma bogoriensis]